MATFTLAPAESTEDGALRPSGHDGLGGDVLLANARWFTRIRWAVVTVLAGAGLLCLTLPATLFMRFGLVAPTHWPWVLAAVLALLNVITMRWVSGMGEATTRRRVAANVWFQVLSDLIVLTVLVYLVGVRDTVMAFAYLFHIALACIFFPRASSFAITVISAGLYIGVAIIVETGLLPRQSVLAGGTVNVPAFTIVAPTVFVLFVVWYLTSSLSDAVRCRDRELAAANARLRRADESKNQQMLRVTHDLKAPFSGIESNIQVLKQIHWEDLSEVVREIINRIELRSATLRSRIGDILLLGSLRASTKGDAASEAEGGLESLLKSVVDESRGLARQKDVVVSISGANPTVRGDLSRMKILFANLISNAVSYSHEGGTVEVAIGDREGITVTVTDHGIGIPNDVLPKIFDDFYRTRDATNFNPKSTGLGLAIVRQIAQNLGLTVCVDSREGEGTTFKVTIPV